jgi:hypothetical protein
MHLCVGVGLAIVDRIYIAGGTQRKESRRAFLECMNVLRRIAGEHGVSLLMSYAEPTLAKFGLRNGWTVGHKHLVQIFTTTEETQNG